MVSQGQIHKEEGYKIKMRDYFCIFDHFKTY